MILGSTPVCAQATIFAMGLMDLFLTSSPDINNTAAAASLIPEAFPAVTVPFYINSYVCMNKMGTFYNIFLPQ